MKVTEAENGNLYLSVSGMEAMS